jgi:outer membrane protein assembly factor BamB
MDAATNTVLWSATLPASDAFASAPPTVADGVVYVNSGSGTRGYDLSGHLLWTGYTINTAHASPLVLDGTVTVVADGEVVQFALPAAAARSATHPSPA